MIFLMNRNDAIAQVQPALKLLPIADGKYRIWATEGSQVACGLTGFTISDDTSHAQLLGSFNSSVSQKEFLVYFTATHRIDVVKR